MTINLQHQTNCEFECECELEAHMSPLSFQLLTVITATICSLDVITASTSISVNVNANALPSSLIPKPQSSPRMSDSTHQTRCMSLTLTKEKQCFLSWARREPTQAE